MPIPTHAPAAAGSIDTKTSAKVRAWTWLDTFLVLILFTIALGVRLTHIDAFPGLDELWHLGLTAGNGSPLSQFEPGTVYLDPPRWTLLESAAPAWAVWTGMDGVLHPPLYCLTLRIWRDVFGTSDFVAHLYSITWSLVAVGFLFDAARRSMDRVAALLVGLAMCFSHTQVYLAQEIRAYQMEIALATIIVWLLTRIETEGESRRKVVLLAWMTLPLLLTHYFTAGAVLAVGVWGVIRLRAHRVRLICHMAAAGVVYAAIWLPFALQQLDDLHTGDAFLVMENMSVWKLILAMLGAPLRPLADRNYRTEYLTVVAGVLYIIPWFGIRRLRPLLPWALFLCVSLLPLIVLDASRSTVHLDIARYLAVITPAVFLLIAGCAWAWSKWAAYAVTIGATFLGAHFLFAKAHIWTDGPDLLTQAQTIEARLAPGDALITYRGTGPDKLGEMLLVTILHRNPLRDVPIVSLSSPMTRQTQAALPARAWLFTFNLELPIDELIPGVRALPDSFRDVFQFVHVERPDRSPATAPVTPSPASQADEAVR